MRLNKKLFCFLFVMFITLICCCAVSAADDSNMETTATATPRPVMMLLKMLNQLQMFILMK